MLRKLLLGTVLAAVTALAVLVVEAIVARATVPDDGYVPPPRGPRTFGSGPPLSFVVLGDSTGAGRGAPYEEGIAVATAEHLAAGGREVALTNLAVSGATLADVRALQLADAVALEPDVVLLSAGANDVTALRSTDAITGDLRAVLDALPDRARIVVTGSPDIGSAPRLAQPLRAVAGRRAAAVNHDIDALLAARGLRRARIAEVTGPLFRADRTLFAQDGYHPAARGYATWDAPLRAALDAAR